MSELAEKSQFESQTANPVKDEFLTMLSHELRNPLQAILGWTRLLRNGSLTAEQTYHALGIIEKNARIEARLIEDLVDMSQISLGRLKISSKPLEILEVLRSAVDAVRPTANAKSIELRVEDEDISAFVMGDPDRLQQVFLNLLSNAVKFTPRGGRIVVEMRREASELKIVFSDTGEGISPDVLPLIFDRSKPIASNQKDGGLGLGLIISKHLVELHGGKIAVQSDGKNRGATFTITLPAFLTTVLEEPLVDAVR